MTPENDIRTIELLERIAKLLAIVVTRGLPDAEITQREQIILLSSAGVPNKEIADLLGTTTGNVGVRLAESRRAAKTNKTTGSKKSTE